MELAPAEDVNATGDYAIRDIDVASSSLHALETLSACARSRVYPLVSHDEIAGSITSCAYSATIYDSLSSASRFEHGRSCFPRRIWGNW